ncbi:MAG TPA: hypothetical protein PLQ91_05070 [Bacteroidales bacterium]|jgi:hypothetical protein|nr:hypothetical protein [Bacteroidales bacterium]HXK91283.1 hypothetical protein [Bacteroidales bacterium]
MRKLFYILIIALLLISSCKSSSQVNIQKEVIIDPIFPSPYEVEYKSIVALPDSLGGSRYKGLAAIEGRINDDLKIEGIKIMKLLLYTERDTVIDYYFGKDSLSLKNIYPQDVCKYLPFFEDFVKTVIVKKREGISNKSMGQITLILRFR